MKNIALISFLKNSINTRSLASYLKHNGYNVICFFCCKPFNENNLSRMAEMLTANDVDIVGVSLVTDDYHSAIVVTSEIKKRLALPIIWGGAHPNVRPDECLNYADMICLGEGEDALLELLKSMESKNYPDHSIKNIWFRTDNGIIKNEIRPLEENLDKYPFPDFDFQTQYVMTENGFESMHATHLGGEYSIMTSRGCPYSCNYCYNSYRRKQYKGKGKYLRTRSIESVIKELELARDTFSNLTRINFWDDSFVARNIEDFQLFKDLYSDKIRLPFFALIEPMAFDFNKIKILKESGLSELQVGIQTGSEKVAREIYNRHISNSKVITVAKQINELGIDVIYDIIFNNPYETEADVADTVKLFLQVPKPFILQGFNLIFYPETEITSKALRDNFISLKENVEDYSTIEGKQNSPTSMDGKSVISERFFQINYSSFGKEYWNTVLTLFAFLHVPFSVIRFFGKSKTSLKVILLKMFVKCYVFAHALKEKFNRKTQPADIK